MDIFYTNLENNTIEFENKHINVLIDINDIVWFNANDIGTALGYKYPKEAIIKNVEQDDKIQFGNINAYNKIHKHPHSIYINESGIYSLLLQSRLDKAKKFKTWVTKTVLPSIRKFAYYKLKKDNDIHINNLMKQITHLEKQNNKLKNELKTEQYPEGALVYVVDYTDEYDNMYRIGKTDNMNKRKKIYDTHTAYKKPIIIEYQAECPLQFETCVRAMLYKYRIKNKKDFYECDIKTIEMAFNKCKESIKCMNQIGGGHKLTPIENELNIFNKELEERVSLINAYNKILYS